MSASPLSLSRRHVLGDLYAKCEPLAENVPVYLLGDENELIGFVDQSLGHYADAYTFHLAEDVCKKLSAGQYTYEFDVENAGAGSGVSVRTIYLKARKAYEKPVSSAVAKR